MPSQFVSQVLPRHLAKKRSLGASTVGYKNNDAMKRNQMMNNIISIVMAVVAVVSAAGIGLYWFYSALFSMTQSIIIHKVIMAKKSKGTTIESKLSKFGI